MKLFPCAATMMVMLASGSALALPGDSADGKQLHEANCTGCHDTSVYTRKDRAVQSMAALQKQMNNCGHATGRTYTEAEMQNMVKYLNDEFYKFE